MSGRGVVIFLDAQELSGEGFERLDTDIPIFPFCYLRFNGLFRINKEKLSYWFSRAIKDLEQNISHVRKHAVFCICIEQVDFNHAHFQEEALFYAMQEWVSKYYKFDPIKHDVHFDQLATRFVFPALLPGRS